MRVSLFCVVFFKIFFWKKKTKIPYPNNLDIKRAREQDDFFSSPQLLAMPQWWCWYKSNQQTFAPMVYCRKLPQGQLFEHPNWRPNWRSHRVKNPRHQDSNFSTGRKFLYRRPFYCLWIQYTTCFCFWKSFLQTFMKRCLWWMQLFLFAIFSP